MSVKIWLEANFTSPC